MSIHKKNGKWYAAVYLGRINDKQEYEWSKGFEKKSDAQLAELELRKSVINNNHKIYTKESFSFISERWLAMREKTVATTTYRTNRACYEAYIEPVFSDKLVKDIEPIDITDFMLSLNQSPATISKVMSILKMIFDFAILMKQLNYNPCASIKKPGIKKKRHVTWSENEISNFLKLRDVKESPCYMAFLILFSTGMRPGEVCGLRWCDWYGDSFVPEVGIDVKRNLTDLKNSNAHNEVYIDVLLEKKLEKHRLEQELLYKSSNKKMPADSFINCLLPDFRPMTPDFICKTFKKILKKNNLEIVSIYTARHSLGTNLMRSGVNPKIVSEILRHSTVRTTLDNYSHVDKQMYKNTISSYNNKLLKRVK